MTDDGLICEMQSEDGISIEARRVDAEHLKISLEWDSVILPKELIRQIYETIEGGDA